MLSRSVPEDIIDIIIDELRNDREIPTLLLCSTVSRSFMFPTRKALFFRIKLDNWIIERFQKLLDSFTSHPHLASYVQQLYINGTDWVYEEPTFSPLLRILTNAGSLRLFSFVVLHRDPDCNWSDLSLEITSAICDLISKSPRLSRVEIEGVVACTFPLQVLNTLPASLRQLSYVDDHSDEACYHGWPDPEGSPSLEPPPPSAEKYLDSLRIGDNSSELCRYLEHPYCSIRLTRLRAISLPGHTFTTRGFAATVFKAAAKTLENLVWNNPSREISSSPIDLSVLRQLRFLSIATLHEDIIKIYNVLANCVLPPVIEEIHITLLTMPSRMEEPPLPTLNKVMRAKKTKTGMVDTIIAAICSDRKGYPQLRYVCMNILVSGYGTLGAAQHRQGLRSWFPKSYATGHFKGCFKDLHKMEQIFEQESAWWG